MLTIILAILKSSGFGSLIGWVGGAINRFIDLKSKKMDHAHELDMRKEDRETMRLEWESRTKVASIEGEAKVEAKAFDTMAASYLNDKAAYGGGRVDVVRGLVRPVATIVFTTAAIIQTGFIFWVAFFVLDMDFTQQQIYTLLEYAILWIFFQAGVCLGWYFANRPGKMPSLKS